MAGNSLIRFETTHGAFTVELYPDEAPATVENFLAYVDAEFFDGTIFHRIVPGFVIQGGGLDRKFHSKETRAPIRNEAKNGLKNLRGTLSMARTGVVDSATSPPIGIRFCTRIEAPRSEPVAACNARAARTVRSVSGSNSAGPSGRSIRPSSRTTIPTVSHRSMS